MIVIVISSERERERQRERFRQKNILVYQHKKHADGGDIEHLTKAQTALNKG